MVSTAAEKKAQKEARKVVVDQLNDLGIPFDVKESTENLETILHNHNNPTEVKPLAAKPAPTDTSADFEVGDPELLRPRTLPLVIKQRADVNGGEWFNESQALWARTLNGYAYQNTRKWNKKKPVLLAILKELGELDAASAAERLAVLSGGNIGIKVTNDRVKNADLS